MPVSISLNPPIIASTKAKTPKISSKSPFLKPNTAPKTKGISKMMSRVFNYLVSKVFTMVEIAFPSALPANAFVEAPITLPMS